MEFDTSSGFEWILLFAIIGSMLSIRLGIPPVAGLLVAGALIGPNILGLVELPAINLFAEIGATLLLFMIGVEFSISKLLKTGLRAIIGGFMLVTMMFILMHEVAILIGLDSLTSLYVAAIFSFSSTAIMMKILEQKKMIDRVEVPVLVAILIIEDIIAVFMLTFFAELKTGTFTSEFIFGAVLVSLAILGFFYVVVLNVLKKFSSIFLRYQADDTLIMFSIALGIGMSILATILGLTPAIGAFLAGSIIAGLPNGRDFEHAIKPFSNLFSSFFFLSIGMLIDPLSLLAHLDIALILIGSFIIFVSVAVAFTFYLISANGRSALFTGLAMLPLGEFSLLLAKESTGVIEINLVGIVSAGVLVSSVLCSLLVGNYLLLFSFIKRTVPSGSLKILENASDYFIHVIGSFEPNGYFHKLLDSEISRLSGDLRFIIAAAVLFLFAQIHLDFAVSFAGYTFPADQILLFFVIVLTLVPAFRLLFSIKRIFDAISDIVSKTAANKDTILRNMIISIFSFTLFANFSILVDLVLLPKIFNWLSLLFALFSIFFFWSALRAVSSGINIKEEEIIDLLSLKILKSQKKD